MIFPPMYFPVYQFHVRLVDPGLHAQPLIESPPMPHAEGLHLVQWLTSDPSKLTSTVRGDMQQFALRDFDSGPYIPHIPVPLMAGPFLVDTLLNSHYTIAFHQPNVKMDSTEVGVFFWGLAMPWICSEIKLPIPKFLAGRASVALSKAASSKLSGALAKVAKATEVLEDALQAPAKTDAEREELIEKGEAYHAADRDKKKAEVFGDSKKFVNEQQASDQRIEGARNAEKQANKDKTAADAESRAAAQEAEQHEAAARAHRDKAQDASSAGTTEDSVQAERGHRAAASSERNMAEREEQRAQAHSDRAAAQREQQRQAQQRSRQANASADHHEAMAQEENERAAGVRSGGSAESIDKADQHAAQAKRHREQARAEASDAERHGAQVQAHEQERASAIKAAESSRRQAATHDAKAEAHANRVEADRRQADAQRARQKSADAAQRSKQLQQKAADHRAERASEKALKKSNQFDPSQKHEKVNPYKTATGMGNTSMLFPSLLAHVPFPGTVQIYMSWLELLRNWAKAIVKAAFAALDGYVGFFFDSVLAPGKTGIAKWLIDTGKSLVSGTILGGLEKLVIDNKIEIKVSTKLGPVSVSAELDQDPDTKKWTWTAKGEASKELDENAKASASASASGDFSSSREGEGQQGAAHEGGVKKWTTGATLENHKAEASVEHTSRSTGESDTTFELGHHKVDLPADSGTTPTPISNATPPVDYTHGSTLAP